MTFTCEERHIFTVCPWCEKSSGCRADHLFTRDSAIFGPWYCEQCNRAHTGTVKAGAVVSVERAGGAKIPHLVLLRRGNLFLVMDGFTFSEHGEPDDDERYLRYYYEEQSCPTNWLRDCVAVIVDNDTDPHGCVEFVRHVAMPDGFDADNADWLALFPEAIPETPT